MFRKYPEFGKVGVSLAFDILAINISFFLAYLIRFKFQFLLEKPLYPFELYTNLLIFVNVVTIIAFYLCGLYRLPRNLLWVDELFAVFRAIIVVALILVTGAFLTTGYRYGHPYSRLLIFIFLCLSPLLITGGHLLLKEIYRKRAARKLDLERVLIVGLGRTAKIVKEGLTRHPELGYEVVGFVGRESGPKRFYASPVLGVTNDLLEIIGRERIHEVIFTEIATPPAQLADLIVTCQRRGVNVKVFSGLYRFITSRARIEELTGIPVISFGREPLYDLNLILKRMEDTIFSILILLLLSPFMLIIALLIKLTTPGPVLFRQERIGKNGQVFMMYKFRTMVRDAEEKKEELRPLSEAERPLFKMRRDPRITKVGGLFRRYSIDELPQLINVIKGEMSLVGPRPSLPSEVKEYEDWHRKRLEVLPGISGLWQVSGRSDLTFGEMVELDIYYIRNWSLSLDLKILLRTLPILLARKGAY